MLANNICPDEATEKSMFGVVRDDETLARIIPSRHFKNGKAKLSLFPVTHIAESGLSLARVDHTNVADLTEYAEKIAAFKAGDKVEGVLLAKVQAVRQIVDGEGLRSLCVLDDPQPEFEPHACAIQSGKLSPDDPEIRRVRMLLMDLFSGPVSIDAACAA